MNKISAHNAITRGIEIYFDRLKDTLDTLNREEIIFFLDTLLEARTNGRQIFIMGNGGSAATASHFVCDFNKGLSTTEQPRFKFICLNDNVPSMMAYANDVSYDDVFVEQLKNLMQKNDLVIGISGSGTSMNVVKAIEYANANGAKTFCLVGDDGGKLRECAQRSLHVAINNMQIVEDIHMIIDHMGMSVLRNQC